MELSEAKKIVHEAKQFREPVSLTLFTTALKVIDKARKIERGSKNDQDM